MQIAENEGSDLGLCCPFTELIDTEVYVDEQRVPKSNCTDAYVEVVLCCSYLTYGPFFL